MEIENKSLLEPKWNVVEFIGAGNESQGISTVPLSWLFLKDNEQYCYWPKSKPRKHIKQTTTPATDWDTWSVKILLSTSVSYKQAITYEKIKAQTTETEEEQNCEVVNRLKRKRKSVKKHDFVSNDILSEEEMNIEPPPKFKIMESVEENNRPILSSVSDDTLSVVSMELMPPPSTHSSSPIVEVIYTEPNLECGENPTDNVTNLKSNNDDAVSFYNLLNKKVDAILDKITSAIILLERAVLKLDDLSSGEMSHKVNIDKIANLETVPRTPFKKYHKLMEYEKLINESVDGKKQLEAVFYMCGGSSPKENIIRGLKRIFSDKLAQKCSWLGRKGNYRIGDLKIMELLKDSVRKNFINLTDKNFEVVVSTWLRQANLRVKRSLKK